MQPDLIILKILIILFTLDGELVLIAMEHLVILKAAQLEIIFGDDMSGSVHASNKTKGFLVLGRGLIQLIENSTIYAEKVYSPNFSAENKIFVLSLHYNGDNYFLFVNGQKVTQFKAKDNITVA